MKLPLKVCANCANVSLQKNWESTKPVVKDAKSTQTYLGLDLGTSGVKAVLIDSGGLAVGESSASLTVSRPFPGWSEQNPADWWQACLRAVDGLSKSHSHELSHLAGIGLSGQMHGATILDKNHKILRPAILWNDARSAEECLQFEKACPDARKISGNITMAGFTAPKILWVKKHEPETYEQIFKILLPKDYVRFCLSGEFVSEMSDASGTLWLDVKRRDWSDDLLAATGLDRSHMPSLVEGTQISSELSFELKSRWNLKGKIPIAGGGGDNAASACGIGAIRPGDGFVSLGTSGVLFVSNQKFSPNTENAVHAFCHAIPDTWHQMGVMLSATDSLNWLANLVGQTSVALAHEVEENFNGPVTELFLPYLSGERTPHNNAGARASFSGLSHSSSAVSMAQSVMEGIAFAFADSKNALTAAGTQINQLTAVGGGSNSNLWLKMIATLLDMEILLPYDGDFGGAFGAARLGLCAATGTRPEEVCQAPKIKTIIQPDPQWANAYEDKYQRFKALYPAIEKATT